MPEPGSWPHTLLGPCLLCNPESYSKVLKANPAWEQVRASFPALPSLEGLEQLCTFDISGTQPPGCPTLGKECLWAPNQEAGPGSRKVSCIFPVWWMAGLRQDHRGGQQWLLALLALRFLLPTGKGFLASLSLGRREAAHGTQVNSLSAITLLGLLLLASATTFLLFPMSSNTSATGAHTPLPFILHSLPHSFIYLFHDLSS